MADCDHRKEVINQLKSLLDELANESPPPKHPYGRACCIQLDSKTEPPEVMVCYKSKIKPDADEKTYKPGDSNDPKPKTKVETCKSRELLGGVLYIGCDCEKRNGLQDECKRRQCQGSPACLTKPPTCCPSQYSNAKHLKKKMLKNHKKCDENYLCYPAVIQCCP
ncbi:hypothetical protein FQR65_LT10191 [Abscondita terminalis]|nr:hypothetical protein FQR65_LT10191 [Abscondita terminalis]